MPAACAAPCKSWSSSSSPRALTLEGLVYFTMEPEPHHTLWFHLQGSASTLVRH